MYSAFQGERVERGLPRVAGTVEVPSDCANKGVHTCKEASSLFPEGRHASSMEILSFSEPALSEQQCCIDAVTTFDPAVSQAAAGGAAQVSSRLNRCTSLIKSIISCTSLSRPVKTAAWDFEWHMGA